MDVNSFKGKVFAITGVGSGIGRALAKALAGEGARLALCDKDDAGLKITSQSLGNAHCFCQNIDVQDAQAMRDFAKAAKENFGHIDAVINNAGVSVFAPAAEMKRDDFEWQMNVNFWGVVNGTEAFIPFIRQRKEGAIINISSVFGLIGFPAQSAYNASKFAIRGYTEALRHEMTVTEPHLLISCVHPGGIKTPILKNARFRAALGNEDHDQAIRVFEANALTTPEKAANVILKAIQKRKERVLIGPDARVIDVIQRLFPVRYFKILNRLIRQRGELDV